MAFVLHVLVFLTVALAPAPPEGVRGEVDGAAEPGTPEPAPLRDSSSIRAERIEALMAGTLDPSVSAEALFSVDLVSQVPADPDELRALLAPTANANTASEGGAPSTEAAGHPELRLQRAYATFFALSPAERQALLDAHARRRREAEATSQAQSRKQARVRALQERAERLEAFLVEQLDPTLDPRPLLTLDLIDWLQDTPGRPSPAPEQEAARRKKKGRVPAEIAPAPEDPPTPPDPLDQALEEARNRLEATLLRYANLGDDAREALFAAHAVRQKLAVEQAEVAEDHTAEEVAVAEEIDKAEQEAHEAAAAREEALDAARAARTEALRRVAEHRALLLGIKEEQARYEAELNRRRADDAALHDKALEWNRKVGELESSSPLGTAIDREADAMYAALREDLAVIRARLRGELEAIARAGESVPTLVEDGPLELPAEIDTEDLKELRREVLERAASLRLLERQVHWQLASALRDDMVLLNRDRLRLLDMASDLLRDRVKGFGSQGVDQVSRELIQMQLELQYQLLALREHGDRVVEAFTSSPVPFFLALVQLLFSAAAFVWWRRRASPFFASLQNQLEKSRAGSDVPTRWLSTMLWYLDRIRRPLELLGILGVALRILGELPGLPSLSAVWGAASWILGGFAVVSLLDAIAERNEVHDAQQADVAELRIHSLRVIGINVIVVGLVLSISRAMVGKGAIHAWVWSTCWFLSVPVAVYLVYRWRPIIFERFTRLPSRTAFVAWVRRKRSPLTSFPAAAAGGAYLLVVGFARFALRQMSAFESTRHLVAWLFRREVAKRARDSAASENLQPLDAGAHPLLEPEASAAVNVDTVAREELETVRALVTGSQPAVTVVVGERGSGKTTFLRRLGDVVGDRRALHVRCPSGGFEELVIAICRALGEPMMEPDALIERLRQGPLCVICIDDAQRLVRPTIGGLRELDRFADFARRLTGPPCWVLAMSTAAWVYMHRTRGERVFFEQVVKLPAWTDEQIGALIRQRTAAAELQPRFRGLVVPSHAEPGGRRKAAERAYYQLLWDYSDGNPAVALHAWRDSLFVNQLGTVVVRLFDQPKVEEIDALPITIHFVLRAILQLEPVRARDIAAITRLPEADVVHAVRYCTARGYLSATEDGLVRIALRWYRVITIGLHRQHLLPS